MGRGFSYYLFTTRLLPDACHENKQFERKTHAFLHAPYFENIGIPAQAGMPKTVSIE